MLYSENSIIIKIKVDNLYDGGTNFSCISIRYLLEFWQYFA